MFQRMMHMATVFVYGLLTLVAVGCSNPLMVTPVPEDLKGKMTFSTIKVTKLASISSSTVVDKVRTVTKAALSKKFKTGRPMLIHVHIEEWKGSTDAVGGKAGAKWLGLKISIKAYVKIIDPSTKKVIAEYGVMADYSQGGLATGTLSFVEPEEALFSKFTYFLAKEL